MSQEIELEGKQYISSKRASEMTGYAQDYIGQLARKSLIEARRVGGLWYISMESLQAYKNTAENFKPEPPQHDTTQDPSTLVLLDGKEYISAGRAAEITGYNADYVGQLARSGSILSQQIGNRWYVEKETIVNHKKEKDALLAAVQSESVGLKKTSKNSLLYPEYLTNNSHSGSGPVLTYINEQQDLLPVIDSSKTQKQTMELDKKDDTRPEQSNIYTIPIRRVRYADIVPEKPSTVALAPAIEIHKPQQSRFLTSSLFPTLVGGVATIVIVLSVGYTSAFKSNSAYASSLQRSTGGATQALSASVSGGMSAIAEFLEPFLTKELIYTRPVNQ